ncbi:MAG: FoF1 ATP synthase subunit a [Candidatus Babeliales bacterium]
MKGVELGETTVLSLAPIVGYEHPFLTINSTFVMHTWFAIALLFIILLPVKWILNNTQIGRFLILSFINFFMDLTTQATKNFSFGHFSFITALFSFILLCNIISVIPWIEEPTQDLNMTLALSIVAFIYIQAVTIRAHGIKNYIKEYFSPFFIMFPLNLVGKFASIISIAFRLFGNIFGSSIITQIYFGAIQGSIITELLGLLTGLNILLLLFFTIFEGFLQAFVFAMLTLTYLSIGLKTEEEG